MLKTTLFAAAAIVAFGATTAYAGNDGPRHDRGHGGAYSHKHKPGPHKGSHRGHKGGKPSHYYKGPYGHTGWRTPAPYWRSWYAYRPQPYCRYVPRKVPVKAWTHRGKPYQKWVWKSVRVCV